MQHHADTLRRLQVRNGGNVDLTTITVSNPTILDDCTGIAELGVGREYTCRGNYSLTWSDIISGVKATRTE